VLIQLKPKHHHLDVLAIFQRGARGVRGARGAVFRDTPQKVVLEVTRHVSVILREQEYLSVTAAVSCRYSLRR